MRNRFSSGLALIFALAVVSLCYSPSAAQATLLDRGPNLVYDDVLNITWTRNANLPGSSLLIRADAKTWAADLVFAGFDDWRLPYASVSAGVGPTTTVVDCAFTSELACRDNEMGYMFYHNLGGSLGDPKTATQTAVGGQQLTGIQPNYWSGTGFRSTGGWGFGFSSGALLDGGEGSPLSAWAVRAGDGGVIPEPSSLLLIGVGMLGLVWARSRRR